jgi:RNAse (barnase) inhibitor barstar
MLAKVILEGNNPSLWDLVTKNLAQPSIVFSDFVLRSQARQPRDRHNAIPEVLE